MPLLLRRNIRAIAFVALAAVASSACVKQNLPGVGLVKFDSEAVFGQSEGQGDIPGFGQANPFADQFPLPDLPLRDLIKKVADKADLGPCPPAKLTTFPSTSASVQVKGLPTEGVYRWKRDIVIIKDAGANPPLVARPFQLESRTIRRVVKKNDHDFTFDMIAPDPFTEGNVVITSFDVNSNPTLLVERTLSGRSVGVINIPTQDVRVPPVNDTPGVFITRIETQNKDGGRVSLFQPILPMLILPLDGGIIRSGQTFINTGIDATSATVLAQQGTVGRTTRVDACGEIVEGYAVTLAQTYSGDFNPTDLNRLQAAVTNAVNTNQTRNITYVFASQFGMLPIGEALTVGDVETDPSGFFGRWTIGGLTPAPVPGSQK